MLYVIKFLVDPREFFNYLNQVFYRAFLFHSTAVIDLSMQANEWSFFKAKPLRVKEAPNKGEVRQREEDNFYNDSDVINLGVLTFQIFTNFR